MGAVGSGPGMRADRPDTEPDRHARGPQPLRDGLRVAGVVGRRQPFAGLDDHRRDAEPGVHRAISQPVGPPPSTSRLLRQLPGQRRLAVRPRPDRVEARNRRLLREAANGDDHVVAMQLVDTLVVADLDPALTDDPGDAPVGERARVDQP